jgi:hypothetical protein
MAGIYPLAQKTEVFWFPQKGPFFRKELRFPLYAGGSR